MGWGTCYIDPQGYLSRITVEQIDDEISESESRVKSAFDMMTTIMASSPADVKPDADGDPVPWPEYIKEQRDLIESTIRENLSCLHDLYAAKRALEQKEVEIEYCANGHGRIKGDWCDEDKCHICGLPFAGTCKLSLVDKDY